MISVALLIIGFLTLVLGVIATVTKNEKLMTFLIKKKADETSEGYIKRATKPAIVIGIVFIIMGLVLYFP